jgi:IS30 family transposase
MEERMMKQHYMTRDERQKLEALHLAGLPVAKIALQLGFCRQTIYNELKTGSYTHTCEWWDETRYSPDKAEKIHRKRQEMKGRPLKIGKDLEYANYLENLIRGIQPDGKLDRRRRYSPAAALAAARKEGRFQTTICTATLYSYIEKGIFLKLSQKDLWEGTRQKKREYKPVQRIAHNHLPSITDRPNWINSREEPGHYEMDLIVSCAKGSGAVLTMTERTGRLEIIRKIKDRKAETIRAELTKIHRQLPDIKSITTDNGPEFLEYQELLAVVGCPVFYCHSYAAWEKGTNENHNRMIRRWFPKGTDFSKIPRREIEECEAWMNNYPRRALGWMTPNEFTRMAA